MPKKKTQENNSFWISYSDLATGLMIVFMLVMLIMVIMQKQQGELQTERVSELTQKIEIILGQKSKLSESINKAFKDDPQVTADPITAQLSIDESALMFLENSEQLNPKGYSFLQQFTPRYICALFNHEAQGCLEKSSASPGEDSCGRLDPESPGGVRRIFITGHADMKGPVAENHDLSTRRAESVVQTMLAFLSDKAVLKAQLQNNAGTLCNKNLVNLKNYAEERLQAVGAGESNHCTQTLNSSKKIALGTPISCDGSSANDASYRRVDFALELTGDDMTGILADVVALREAVQETRNEQKPENNVGKMAAMVASRCWRDVSSYHGCDTFIRDCLSNSKAKYCEDMIGLIEKDLGLKKTVKRLCESQQYPKCPK